MAKIKKYALKLRLQYHCKNMHLKLLIFYNVPNYILGAELLVHKQYVTI